MSHIFISHSSRNNPQVAALRDWLAAQGREDEAVHACYLHFNAAERKGGDR